MSALTSVHGELINLILFFLSIAKTIFVCGYVAIPLVLAEVALNLLERR
jgi:hypothetical protein